MEEGLEPMMESRDLEWFIGLRLEETPLGVVLRNLRWVSVMKVRAESIRFIWRETKENDFHLGWRSTGSRVR
jgi:hypothetical protein